MPEEQESHRKQVFVGKILTKSENYNFRWIQVFCDVDTPPVVTRDC